MLIDQGSVLVTGENEVTTSIEMAPVTPFAGVTLMDPTPGATDTVTVGISYVQGTLADGTGYSGLTKGLGFVNSEPAYVEILYTLPKGTAAQVTAELDNLVFTASATAPSATTSLILRASSGQPNNALNISSDTSTTSTETDVDAVPIRSISLDSSIVYDGGGRFTLSGTPQSVSGATRVEITASVNRDVRDLGVARLNGDGSFTFTDNVSSPVQGFITATETDVDGGQVSNRAPFSLQAGLGQRTGGQFTARQIAYTPDGSAETAVTLFREDGSRRVKVEDSGTTYQSKFFDTFLTGSHPENTFVFDQYCGLDKIIQFRIDGVDHDTLSFTATDYGYSVAEVLNNTRDARGGAVILDPVTGDTVKLNGISKAQITANQQDFAFHQ